MAVPATLPATIVGAASGVGGGPTWSGLPSGTTTTSFGEVAMATATATGARAAAPVTGVLVTAPATDAEDATGMYRVVAPFHATGVQW